MFLFQNVVDRFEYALDIFGRLSLTLLLISAASDHRMHHESSFVSILVRYAIALIVPRR